MDILHDGLLALSALGLGGMLHHGLAWLRRRDLLGSLLFSATSLVVALYAFSLRTKLDTTDMERWVRHDRVELALILVLLVLFVETVATATRAGPDRRRYLVHATMVPLLVWHILSPWGFAVSDVRGMERLTTQWGESFWWTVSSTSPLYHGFLLYTFGWTIWCARRAWIWARRGSAFSGWTLMLALAILVACLVVEFAAQLVWGSFPFPLVESSFLGLLGATSLLLSDEVLRIAVLQRQLESSRAELARINAELERRVDERTSELKDALSELEMFSYSIHHDLRTPLRAIDGFSQAVLEDHGASIGPDGRRNLERVRKAAQKLGELFDDLVGLIRSRGVAIRAEDLDLSAMARDVAGELCERFPERDVHIEIQPSLVACTDPALLRTALLQILSNAWKFTSEVRAPLVEVFRDGSWLVVRDNGVGFDDRQADRLFQPFQRLHSAEAYPGNGMGLAIVDRILRRLGGSVAASVNPGGGAEFRLRVPGLARARTG